MYVKILYDNEQIIVLESALPGYDGAVILELVEALPPDATENMVSEKHLLKMHSIKIAEASLVLSGFPLTTGLLFAESQALGITMLELATRVRTEFQAELDYEIYRRVKREEASNQ